MDHIVDVTKKVIFSLKMQWSQYTVSQLKSVIKKDIFERTY